MNIGIIPARFASSRFPGKPLARILGKSMIQRVWEQANASRQLDRVIVATDDERIFDEVKSFGGTCHMTESHHQSGTDRCAEVAAQLELDNTSVVINIQGDEPYIRPEQIDLLCDCFSDPQVQIATLIKSFRNVEDFKSANAVKTVIDKNGRALYFSRATIPFFREVGEAHIGTYWQHIGIYGYRAGTLKTLAGLEPSILEKAEKLEQLRWLENGFPIQTARAEYESWSIDTPEDLENVIRHFGNP
jgi:3-deoxy-manno-octulosonate cytidylyltransferase (CMP-KDO synthetase)